MKLEAKTSYLAVNGGLIRLRCVLDTANGPAISDGLIAETEPRESTGAPAHLLPSRLF
jgi:hypothetical protein